MTLAHATVDVAEMRALLERVGIVGPLAAYDCGEYGSDVDDAEGTAVAHTTGPAAAPVAALIVAAINSLPALLDRLERAEARVGAAREHVAQWDALDGALGEGLYSFVRTAMGTSITTLRAALDDEAPR